MKKVLMLVWNDLATDARVVREASALQSAGFDVVVLSTDTGKQKVDFAFENIAFDITKTKNISSGFDKLNIARVLVSRLKVMFKMLRRIISEKPDILHVHDVNMAPLALFSLFFNRMDVVYDAHEISTDREGYKKVRPFIEYFERRMFNHSKFSITTTKSRAEFFSREYGIQIPEVVQNRANYSGKFCLGEKAKSNSVDSKRKRVIYQGGLQIGRGITTILRVSKRLPDVDFLFVGGGIQAPLVEAASNDQPNIIYIPTVPNYELIKYTQTADVGLQLIRNTCLNHYTTDSNKLFEYIQAGVPVLASNFPEISNIVDKYKVGYVVNPDNDDEIVEKLNELLYLNPEKKKKLIENIEIAKRDVSWEKEKEKLVNLYLNTF